MSFRLEFVDPLTVPTPTGAARASLWKFEHAGAFVGRIQLWCGSDMYVSPVGLRVLAMLMTTLADNLEQCEVRP